MNYSIHPLNNFYLKKVLCHELTHAAMFSYGVDLTHTQEELVADLMATYGQEIICKTNKIFQKYMATLLFLFLYHCLRFQSAQSLPHL